MLYTYVPPPIPTFARWWQITSAFRGLSLLRMLEYEKLAALRITGRVLDMGGGQNAPYLSLLPDGLTILSANIDPKIRPTHLVEPGQSLPYEDESFDGVICLNTLEHIYDADSVLRELFRVVKPGGDVHVMVPFMFRIHGHPDDYFRGTPSWWRESCARIGFSSLTFIPLVWGRRSTGWTIVGSRGLFPRAQLHLAMLLDALVAKLFLRGSTISGRRGDRICSTSPGWFMSARK